MLRELEDLLLVRLGLLRDIAPLITIRTYRGELDTKDGVDEFLRTGHAAFLHCQRSVFRQATMNRMHIDATMRVVLGAITAVPHPSSMPPLPHPGTPELLKACLNALTGYTNEENGLVRMVPTKYTELLNVSDSRYARHAASQSFRTTITWTRPAKEDGPVSAIDLHYLLGGGKGREAARDKVQTSNKPI
ncbi:hypothetical protein VI08_15285 [Luteibacter yeojuensis]|uniref:Uncharacterized protein n=1 Tax=Luteibacter yeojuensis TaxID=345309 RepID=A0A0F3KFJ9_9GAMM|nr:hypothetical protein VI08_15285 [Luteibacter yeojuensis]